LVGRTLFVILHCVGGFPSSPLSSVEILDEGSDKWRTGPELPFGIGHAQMVEDHDEGVVLVGGQSSSNEFLNTLYQLPHAGVDVKWTRMNQQLKKGRKSHVAFLVPDTAFDCA
jgi:hypothetical protein